MLAVKSFPKFATRRFKITKNSLSFKFDGRYVNKMTFLSFYFLFLADHYLFIKITSSLAPSPFLLPQNCFFGCHLLWKHAKTSPNEHSSRDNHQLEKKTVVLWRHSDDFVFLWKRTIKSKAKINGKEKRKWTGLAYDKKKTI